MFIFHGIRWRAKPGPARRSTAHAAPGGGDDFAVKGRQRVVQCAIQPQLNHADRAAEDSRRGDPGVAGSNTALGHALFDHAAHLQKWRGAADRRLFGQKLAVAGVQDKGHDAAVRFGVLQQQADDLLAARAGIVEVAIDLFDHLIQLVEQVVVERLGHAFLAAEVLVDRADGDIRAALDIVHRDAVVAVLDEQLQGRAEDAAIDWLRVRGGGEQIGHRLVCVCA